MGMGLSMGGPRKKRAMSEINVTPMVDIMLVLLIIFMVAAPLLTHGVEVDLPDAAAESMPTSTEPLVVTVGPDGRPYLEDRVVPLSDLAVKIRTIRGENKKLQVFVRGDTAASYGAVMKVMGELQAAGVDRVGLITEPVQ